VQQTHQQRPKNEEVTSRWTFRTGPSWFSSIAVDVFGQIGENRIFQQNFTNAWSENRANAQIASKPESWQVFLDAATNDTLP
jgi:hypothetical protein